MEEKEAGSGEGDWNVIGVRQRAARGKATLLRPGLPGT